MSAWPVQKVLRFWTGQKPASKYSGFQSERGLDLCEPPCGVTKFGRFNTEMIQHTYKQVGHGL